MSAAPREERDAFWSRRSCAGGSAARLAVGASAARPPARQLLASTTSRPCSVSEDRVDVRYVLDQAEIPTVQERRARSRRGARAQARRGASGLVLASTAGASRSRSRAPPAAASPHGAGGLRTTRLELPLRAAVDAPRRVELRDGTFPGRVGWKAIVSAPGEGTAVRSTARRAATPRTACAATRRICCRSPLDRRDATFGVTPGDGTLVAPKRRGRRALDRARAETDGFAGLFEDAGLGRGRAAAPAAGGVRLGRAARAVARPRQGDGRRLPGRHARHRRGTRWRSARPSRSRTRSACSRSAS